jgi:hypothetical protein
MSLSPDRWFYCSWRVNGPDISFTSQPTLRLFNLLVFVLVWLEFSRCFEFLHGVLVLLPLSL